MKSFDNPNLQGNAGVGTAINHYISVGCAVSIPVTDTQDYDLIVEKDGQVDRVQVKTTTVKNSPTSFKVDLRTKGGNRSGTGKTKYHEDCLYDILFVLTGNDRCFSIPDEEIDAHSSIVVGNKAYTEFEV